MNKVFQTMPQSKVKWLSTSKPVASKVFSLFIALSAFTGCSSNYTSSMLAMSKGKVDPRYNVAASPRVVRSGHSIPKGGGRAISAGKPYVIAGRVYRPRDNPNYLAIGTASWYGDAFHGRRTANGEIFDKHSIVAAHPTLPLPSYVRVTNLRNSRSMIVRVNDRGPFHGRRLIDLSQRAAELLGFKHTGTAPVKVEYMGRASLKGSDDRKLVSTLLGPSSNDPEGRFASLTPLPSKNARDFVHAHTASSSTETLRTAFSEDHVRERSVKGTQNQFASLATAKRQPERSSNSYKGGRPELQDRSLRAESVPMLRSSIDPNTQAEMAALVESISTGKSEKKNMPQVLAQILNEEPMPARRSFRNH